MSAELMQFMADRAKDGTLLRDALLQIRHEFSAFDFKDSATIGEEVVSKTADAVSINDIAMDDFHLLVDCITAYTTASIQTYREAGKFYSHSHLGFLVGIGAAERPANSQYMEFYDREFRHGLIDGRWLGMLPDFYEMAKQRGGDKH